MLKPRTGAVTARPGSFSADQAPASLTSREAVAYAKICQQAGGAGLKKTMVSASSQRSKKRVANRLPQRASPPRESNIQFPKPECRRPRDAFADHLPVNRNHWHHEIGCRRDERLIGGQRFGQGEGALVKGEAALCNEGENGRSGNARQHFLGQRAGNQRPVLHDPGGRGTALG